MIQNSQIEESIMAAVPSGSVLHLKASPSAVSSLNKQFPATSQLNASPITRRLATQCAAVRRSAALEKKFFGARLRVPGSERLHLWRSDGPGRSPKLKVVVRSSLSGVPEKPLGLYDPRFDKDSCGVGFVAELSGESSRKTVSI